MMVSKRFLWAMILLLIAASVPATGASSFPGKPDRFLNHLESAQQDSADKVRLRNVDEVARRVDSLQFIVVYNAQLLRRDLDSKVIWIYVMLGVMIIASMMMYGALNQAQRFHKDLEERVFAAASSSVKELEARIMQLESDIGAHAPPKRSTRPKKKL
jgi:outer membrane murein-binding lipoprotein Lpp